MELTHHSESRMLLRVIAGLTFTAVLALAALPSIAAAIEQPYESGPVVKSNWLEPYAPYTMQPYETGPVMKSNWLAE